MRWKYWCKLQCKACIGSGREHCATCWHLFNFSLLDLGGLGEKRASNISLLHGLLMSRNVIFFKLNALSSILTIESGSYASHLILTGTCSKGYLSLDCHTLTLGGSFNHDNKKISPLWRLKINDDTGYVVFHIPWYSYVVAASPFCVMINLQFSAISGVIFKVWI